MSRYVIIDLEMCYVQHTPENAVFRNRNELIQIGAVLLDEEYEVSDTFMTLVAPSTARSMILSKSSPASPPLPPQRLPAPPMR